MSKPFKIISVFTDPDRNYLGNSAAIVKLENPLPEKEMQEIASDLNQPATSFLWKQKDKYQVRWFAPDEEIGLCGHGSLAAFAFLDKQEKITLHYKNGIIEGSKKGHFEYSMLLDAIISEQAGHPDEAIIKGLNVPVKEYYKNKNKDIIVLENEKAVASLNPNFGILKNMEPFGIIVTAPGDREDFVSRTFVPKVQQLEDHATGSSHAALTPFWSQRLGKQSLTALQLSPRGGRFECDFFENKVALTGKVRLIAEGQIE